MLDILFYSIINLTKNNKKFNTLKYSNFKYLLIRLFYSYLIPI